MEIMPVSPAHEGGLAGICAKGRRSGQIANEESAMVAFGQRSWEATWNLAAAAAVQDVRSEQIPMYVLRTAGSIPDKGRSRELARSVHMRCYLPVSWYPLINFVCNRIYIYCIHPPDFRNTSHKPVTVQRCDHGKHEPSH